MKTYLRHRTLNVIDVKELIALEYLDFEGKYKNYVESHNFYELCYVEQGEIMLDIDGERCLLKTGELIMIQPGCRHSYSSNQGNLSRVFVICFECTSHTLRLLSGVSLATTPDEVYCIKKIIGECKTTFKMNDRDQLESLASPAFGGQQAIILQLEYLLIGLLRRHLSEKRSDVVFLSREKFYPDLVDIITGYLRDNVRQRISLKDVCERFNYSRSFICKIFKEQTGKSLISYFNRLKIDEAKKLLCDTDMTVISISELLGFSEAKYFGVTFKKQEGVSPQAYRAASRIDAKTNERNGEEE